MHLTHMMHEICNKYTPKAVGIYFKKIKKDDKIICLTCLITRPLFLRLRNLFVQNTRKIYFNQINGILKFRIEIKKERT